MRKQLFSLAAAALSAAAFTTEVRAQTSALSLIGGARFGVTAPASLAGSRTVTYAQSGGGWGPVSLNPPLINVPVVRAFGTGGVNTDSLLCTPAANGTGGLPSLSGKVAIFYRGNCNFSEKAYNAQLAGAVAAVIINNIPGGPVGMGAGTNGAQVTIPVFMVSDVDGAVLASAIAGGSNVTVSIGEWGLGYTSDIGIVPGNSAPPHAGAIPMNQLMTTNNNPSAYHILNGSIAANYGTDTQRNLKTVTTVNWVPNGGSAMQVWKDTAALNVDFAPSDSLTLPFSTGFFNPHASTRGRFDIQSMLMPATPDATMQDNSETKSMYVTDSIYCKGQWNADSMRPKYQLAYGYSGLTLPLSWGPLFYTAVGGQYPAKMQFSVSNATAGSSLNGANVTTCAFKWVDGSAGNPADQVIQGGELTLVATGYKAFSTTDSSFDDFIVPFDPSSTNGTIAPLENSTWYYYTVTPSDPSFYYVTEGPTNDLARVFTANQIDSNKREYTAVQYTGDINELLFAQPTTGTFRMLTGYNNPNINIDSVDITFPLRAFNVAVHVSTIMPSKVDDLALSINKFNIFPNPSTGLVNVAYDFKQSVGQSQITVFDGAGRTVASKSISGGSGQISFELQHAATGTYWLVLGNTLGTKSYQFQVVK